MRLVLGIVFKTSIFILFLVNTSWAFDCEQQHFSNACFASHDCALKTCDAYLQDQTIEKIDEIEDQPLTDRFILADLERFRGITELKADLCGALVESCAKTCGEVYQDLPSDHSSRAEVNARKVQCSGSMANTFFELLAVGAEVNSRIIKRQGITSLNLELEKKVAREIASYEILPEDDPLRFARPVTTYSRVPKSPCEGKAFPCVEFQIRFFSDGSRATSVDGIIDLFTNGTE